MSPRRTSCPRAREYSKSPMITEISWLKSELIVLSVSDTRKAEAAKAALEGPVSNLSPASILQTHPRTVLFIDPAAAALLTRKG